MMLKSLLMFRRCCLMMLLYVSSLTALSGFLHTAEAEPSAQTVTPKSSNIQQCNEMAASLQSSLLKNFDQILSCLPAKWLPQSLSVQKDCPKPAPASDQTDVAHLAKQDVEIKPTDMHEEKTQAQAQDVCSLDNASDCTEQCDVQQQSHIDFTMPEDLSELLKETARFCSAPSVQTPLRPDPAQEMCEKKEPSREHSEQHAISQVESSSQEESLSATEGR